MAKMAASAVLKVCEAAICISICNVSGGVEKSLHIAQSKHKEGLLASIKQHGWSRACLTGSVRL